MKAANKAKTAKKPAAKPAPTPTKAARAGEGAKSKSLKTPATATPAARATDPGGEKGKEQAAIAARDGMKVPYRHPEKPGLTWSGRGRKPQWVVDWLVGFGTLDQLAVPARCDKTMDIFQGAAA